MRYEEKPQIAAPKKFIKVYALLFAESFLYKFSKKAINNMITPMDAMMSDAFIL
jgi:hypothetical protein